MYSQFMMHGQKNIKLYSECLTEALVIQHAQRMRRIVICGLYGCTVFFHMIS